AADEDLSVRLKCDRVRHREDAEVVRDPAAGAERPVEVTIRQPAIDPVPPVAVSVLELTDGQDLAVGLDRDILRSLWEEPLRVAEDLVRPHHASRDSTH